MPVMRTLTLYEGVVTDVHVGHGGFVFSCGQHDNRLSLHDTNSGEVIITLDTPSEGPTCVSVAPDGIKTAYGTSTGAVFIWDVLSPGTMESFRPDEETRSPITALAWHPRGHVLAVAAASGTVFLWDFVVGTLLSRVYAHEAPVTAVAWTANGRLLVSIGEDALMRIWNPRTVDNLGELSTDSEQKPDLRWHSGPIRALDTLWDMSCVAISGSDDGSVLLSGLKPGVMCEVFHAMPSHKSPVTAVKFAPLDSPKPLRAASADSGGIVQLFEMDRRLPMGHFNHNKAPVTQLEFSSDADTLFSAAGKAVIAWDARVAPDEEQPVNFACDAPVTRFAITNNGRGLAVACKDGKLRVFDVRRRSEQSDSNVDVTTDPPKPTS